MSMIIVVIGLFLISYFAQAQDNVVELTGKVEAKEVDVNTKIPGRVLGIVVSEGQEVKAGDKIAKIDDRDLKTNESQAMAGLAAAEGDLAKAAAGSNLVGQSSGAAIEKAQAGVMKAEADELLAKTTYQRTVELHKAGFASDQDLEKVEREYKAAQAGVQAAYGDLNTAKASLYQVDVYNADMKRAQAAIDKAKADLTLIKNNLAETEIKAPCDGVISSLNVEEEELVSTGMALMSITDYKNNWVNIKVPQTQLNKLALDQELTVHLPGSDKQYTGKIESISSKPEFAAARATNDRGEKDIISYNVKIRLNVPELRPGMNVYVKF
ncbi:MAG: HlyD family secretion protein [Peptococcaceae bacterium]|nr:HlyD family secretion protein [Peptococcaceae bacterium]